MDYAMEYALMSDIYDEMTEANEGFFGNIGKWLANAWNWIITKITDLINRLFKKKKKLPTANAPTAQTDKSGKYSGHTGRDANGKVIKRMDQDPNQLGGRLASGAEKISAEPDYIHKVSGWAHSVLKQSNQIGLHIGRIDNDLNTLMNHLEKALRTNNASSSVISITSSSSATPLDRALAHVEDNLDKNTEELDGYLDGLKEVLNEEIHIEALARMTNQIVDEHLSNMIRHLQKMRKTSQDIQNLINKCNESGIVTDNYTSAMKHVTDSCKKSIIVVEKVVNFYEKL